MSSTTVAVAGATGLLGQHTVRALRTAGFRIVALARQPERLVVESEHEPAVTRIPCDLTQGPPPPDTLRDCDVVINLVGIAVENGNNTFQRVHIDAVEHLCTAAQLANIRRLIHVSVVRVQGSTGPYFESKVAGERVVQQSGLDYTILRPGLVYGEGDDMMTRLVELVRALPIFAVPRGPGALQVIDAQDVARSIVATISTHRSIGRSYDIVGPQRLTLTELVHRVADALGVGVWTPPVPRWTMQAAANAMEAILSRPVVTRSQVAMLIAGLYGDPQPARRDLDFKAQALTDARIVELAGNLEPRAPAIRLVTGHEHRQWLAGMASGARDLGWLLPAVLVALLMLPTVIEDIWARMMLINVSLSTVLLLRGSLPWKSLLAASLGRLGTGVAAAAVMFVGSLGVLAGLDAFVPDLETQTDAIYGWARAFPMGLTAGAIVLIATAEDIVWRAGIALPLAARLGPLRGSALAAGLFAIGHMTSGPPILGFAAAIAGLAWSLLTIRGRSLFATFVCHVSWDIAIVFAAP